MNPPNPPTTRKTLAFDIYGTLIDTHGIVARLRELIGDAAPAFSRSWRAKQLEYTFRRGLMQRYEDFAACTRQSLLYCRDLYGYTWSERHIEDLLQAYRALPAFADAAPALRTLREGGVQCHAFSNGSERAVKELLAHAGIADLLPLIVSVDDIKTFKPSAAVYRYFLERSGADKADTWLVSGNPFDILGAINAGWNTAWLRRKPGNIYDPWGMQPDLIVGGLDELVRHVLPPQ